ncbi:MAG: hypothetical protein IJ899_05030 [Blautia sp.]|nr:hypothetical protein [Blautia sp.]
MSKIRMNISVDEDTAERLRQYAWEHHSSVSKAISDLIWSAKVKNEQIRGQQRITIPMINKDSGDPKKSP